MASHLPTVIKLKKTNRSAIPAKFKSDDDRFSESFVEYCLNTYTKEGEKVFDPFTGLGTTFQVAEQMGRIPYGIELNKARFEYIKQKTTYKDNIVQGSALDVMKFGFSNMELCITSPPYMTVEERKDPLTLYASEANYQTYLKQICTIFSKIKNILKLEAFVVVEVSNIKHQIVTPLAWDIAMELAKIFHFAGETIISWQGEPTEKGIYGSGYDHSYCLVFQNT